MKENIGTILIKASRHLKSCGIKESRAEAEILLAHFLGKDRAYLFTFPEEQPPVRVKRKFWRAVKRRGEGCPVAYITGKKEFYGLDFMVGEGVLIPRPETEILVDEARCWLGKQRERSFNLLDLGTGSGVIAITLASLFPKAGIRAVDISRRALQVAKKNAQMHKVENRISFVRGSYENLSSCRGREKFDVVAANPPYITLEEMKHLPAEVQKYEPREALCGGRDGLEGYRAIIKILPFLLARPSLAILEVGPTTAPQLLHLCREAFGRYYSMDMVTDYSGKDRAVKILI